MTKKQIIEYLSTFDSRDNRHNQIEKVGYELKRYKKKYVKIGDENKANEIWVYEQILKIQSLYLQAYEELVNLKFYEGWCTFERCGLKIRFLKPHFDIQNNNYFIEFIDNHIKRYQSIFPYKIFMSPEVLKSEMTCSICEKRINIRNPCGHEVGEVYNGEMCYKIITKSEFLGVAMVENPSQNYSVPFIIDNKTGEKIDQYDYSVVKYLMKRLQSPFDSWDVAFKKKRHTHSKFNTFGRNDKCPCGSKNKYKKCCLNKDGVLMPHVEFILSNKPLKELQTIEYNY